MGDQVSAVRQFNRFYTRYIGLLDDTLLDSPVTLTEGRILFEIEGRNDCNATVLRESLNLDRGYVSRILAKLVRMGLVQRGADPGDRRIRHLTLTLDGRKLLQEINQRADAHIGAILKSMTATECRRLVKAMTDIRLILDKTG